MPSNVLRTHIPFYIFHSEMKKWHETLFNRCYEKKRSLQIDGYFQPLSQINIFYKLIFHFQIIISLKICQAISASSKCLSVWVSLTWQWEVTLSKMSCSIQNPGNLCCVKVERTCQYSYTDKLYRASLTLPLFFDLLFLYLCKLWFCAHVC